MSTLILLSVVWLILAVGQTLDEPIDNSDGIKTRKERHK